jgi:hypothetical protein
MRRKEIKSLEDEQQVFLNESTEKTLLLYSSKAHKAYHVDNALGWLINYHNAKFIFKNQFKNQIYYRGNYINKNMYSIIIIQ